MRRKSSFDRIRPRQMSLCTVSGILQVKNTVSGYSIIRNWHIECFINGAWLSWQTIDIIFEFEQIRIFHNGISGILISPACVLYYYG
jgi:hypothetical protein